MTNTLDCLSNSLKQNEFRLMSWESTQLLAYFLLFFLSPVSRMVIKNTYVLCLTQDCKLHRDQKIPIIILQDVHERTVS